MSLLMDVLTASAGQLFENSTLFGGTVTSDALVATGVKTKTAAQS
jgi:hypothetical protein